jgi:hypothetical protein
MDFKKLKLIINIYTVTVPFLVLIVVSCSPSTSKKERALYQTHCASCHLLPSIGDLTKEIWEAKILPDMGARMGVRDSTFNPLEGMSFSQMDAINKTGIYPITPTISKNDWQIIKNYIISNAPDSLSSIKSNQISDELSQFIPKPISLDTVIGSTFTFLHYDVTQKKLLIGDISGSLFQYDFNENKKSFKGNFGSAIVDYTKKDSIAYVTAVGYLGPSEISSGKIFMTYDDNTMTIIPEVLHRPVNNLVDDLNNDGKDELVVSEFGDLTGELSLLIKLDSLSYEKRVLLNQPGSIRVISKDMNKDGKKDLIALTSQGDETITILYQEDNLTFRPEKVVRFSPIYGVSWFELIDYDGDGDDDIITANGDNADKSYIQKPYHGLRIHINDGKNNFEEKYFYSMYGATRLVARDFDQDGDVDFGVISTFPDYVNKPKFTFVYLENINSENFTFNTYTFKDSNLGRWFLMDAADIDNDGDEDIILSAFTYVFTPVPDELSKLWKEKNVDIMLLENKLIKN